MKRRVLSMFLAVVMTLGLAAPAIGAEELFTAKDSAAWEDMAPAPAAPEDPAPAEDIPAAEPAAPVEEEPEPVPEEAEPAQDEPAPADVPAEDEPMAVAEESQVAVDKLAGEEPCETLQAAFNYVRNNISSFAGKDTFIMVRGDISGPAVWNDPGEEKKNMANIYIFADSKDVSITGDITVERGKVTIGNSNAGFILTAGSVIATGDSQVSVAAYGKVETLTVGDGDPGASASIEGGQVNKLIVKNGTAINTVGIKWIDGKPVNATGTVGDVQVEGGEFSISYGTVGNITANGGTIEMNGSNGTVTGTVHVTGGDVTLKGSGNFPPVILSDGTLTIDSGCTVGTINAASGTVTANGTVTELNVTGNASDVTIGGSGTYKTISIAEPGGTGILSDLNWDEKGLGNEGTKTLRNGSNPVDLTKKQASGTIRIGSKFDPSFSVTPKGKTDLEYTGTAQQLLESGAVASGELKVKYRLYDDIFTETDTDDISRITGEAVGKYDVYYKAIGDYTYKDKIGGPVSVTIGKAQDAVSAPPQAKTDLIYSGSEQPLVDAGTTTVGTLEYSLDGSSYSEVIPAGTDAGTYSVWYKVEGTDNYEGTTAQKIPDIQIAQQDVSITWSDPAGGYIYTGTDRRPTATVTPLYTDQDGVDVVVTVEGDKADGGKAVNAGDYTAKAELSGEKSGNYNITDGPNWTKAFKIIKAEPAVNAPTAKPGLTYTGETQELIDAGSTGDGTMQYALGDKDGATGYSADIPKATDAGTYYVWYKVVGDDNHNDSEPAKVEVTIGEATPTVTVDDVSGTYGEEITINAEVTVGATGIDPSELNGEIEFKVGSTELGTATVTGGTAALKVGGGEQEKQHALFGENGKDTTITATYTSSSDNIGGGNGTGAATIEQRVLKYDVTATDRDYNGTTTVDVTLTPNNLVGSDSVTLTATGNVDGTDAKTYEQVALRDITIAESAGAKYYRLAQTTVESVKIPGGVTISRKVVELTWELDNKNELTINYDGGEHTVSAEVSNKALPGDDVHVTVKVAPAEGAGSASSDTTVTGAGTYTATATGLTGDAAKNYTLDGSGTAEKTITIRKVDATCTAPAEMVDLTYTGEAQQLVSAETPTGGTMMYALGESGSSAPEKEFRTDIPTGTDAGTYYVWYYVQGDANHNDSTKKFVTVTIAKAEVTFSVSGNSHTYDGGEKKATVTNTGAGKAPKLDETTGYKVTYGSDKADSQTDVGEYEIHITLTPDAAKNYKFKEQSDAETELTVEGTKLSITQAKSEVTDVTITAADGELTYGDDFTLSAKVVAPGTVTGTVTFSAGGIELGKAASAAEGGIWTVTVGADERDEQHAIFDNAAITAEYSGDDNIKGSSGDNKTVTVAKRPLAYTVTAEARVWDGSTDVTVTLAATNTVTGDTVTLTAKGDLANEGKAGTYTQVNLSEVKIGGADEKYYTTDEAKSNVDLTGPIEIAKDASSVTAPVGKFGLTYTGEPLPLIDVAAGVSDGSTAKYYVGAAAPEDGAAEWQTDISAVTGVDAGEYTVWYYADGDENHNDTPFASIKVTIGPATVSFAVGAEDKADWAAKGETNDDPNAPNGYTREGGGTSYALTMIYDSYGHKANVVQTESEAVKIAAGNTNGFTVSYKKGETELAQVRDAGTYEIWVTIHPTEGNIYNYVFDGQGETRSLKLGEIKVAPYPTAVSWSHLNYVYHGHPMHPEIRVLSPFKNDMQMPGGLPEDFDIASPEAYDGEYLVAFARTDGSDADSYTVTAALYGKNAGNYTITDPTETVTIIPAPVTFTVGDNIWDITKEDHPTEVTLRAAWGEVTTTPDAAVHESYPAAGSAIGEDLNTTVEYWKDGVKVEGAPTEPGTYQVWVAIGNENFRHAAATDSASHHVGELIVTDKPESIRTYTVKFDPGYEKAPAGPADMTGVFANQTVIIPPASGENEGGRPYDLTRKGYSFLGWSYGGRTYQPNEEFHMPASDVTFKAEWVQAVAVGGTVLREREDSSSDPTPVNGARVVLKHGSEQIAEAVTDSDGHFTFPPAAPGIYNLEVTYENGSNAKVVKTFLVTLEDGDSPDGEYILPSGVLNTVVEVAPGVTAAADMSSIVSGKDDTGVYTQEDKTTVQNGGTVEFKMNIDLSDELTQEQTQTVPVPKEQIGMVLDMTLTKTVTKSGSPVETDDIHDTKTPVTTVIHLPAELQGKSSYTIYRFHDTSNVEGSDTLEMQTITTSSNSNGEYLKVVRGGTAIEVHAKFYSIYVLTWKQSSGGYWPGVDKSALEAAITAAGALNKDDYTEESWAALESALAAAKTVDGNAGATQAEVDDALNALTASQSGLVKKGEEPGGDGPGPGEDIPAPPKSGTGWSYDYDTGDWYFYKDGKLVSDYWVGFADGASAWANNWYYVGADGKMLTGFHYLDDLKGGKAWYMLQTTNDRSETGKMLTGWQWTYSDEGEGYFSPKYGSQGMCTWNEAWGAYDAAAGLWADGSAHIG